MRLLLLVFLLILPSFLAAQSIPNLRLPLVVSHLSGNQKYMLRRAGAPKHNALTRTICFKRTCRGVIGWKRTQQRNKFKKYKKPGIPRLKYLKNDSLKLQEVKPLPVVTDTVTTVASEPEPQQVRKDSVIAFVFDDVLFDRNSSHLKHGFMKRLDSLSGIITKYENYRIHVVGHTDNSGSEVSNATLSKDRAEAVAFYLASRGIDPSVITAEGRGSSEPIADNTKTEGRQKNRRVQVFLKFD